MTLTKQKFDVYILPKEKRPGRFLGLNLSLEEARRKCRLPEMQDVVPTVVPVEYRASKVLLDEAREIAEVELERKIAQGSPLSRTMRAVEYGYCWLFAVADYELQAQGYRPGQQVILVDKLDGQTMTEERFYELDALTEER